MRVEIENIQPVIGGIVHADKAALTDPDVVAQCREALEDRGVLVFPRLGLTDREQLAFTDLLGDRVNFTKHVPGGATGAEPEVYKITLDKETNDNPEYVLGTYFWHIDGVTMDMPLPKATLLTARKLSATGGQTEFCNTYAAYEHLPEHEKGLVDGLTALHKVEAIMKPLYDAPTPDDFARWTNIAHVMEHPLVWEHVSGRKSLVLGAHADRVVGMTLPEGRALLARLNEWAGQPDFRYTHHWQDGDLVIWDNCGLMHRVIPYPDDSGRMMHRTTIAGTERVAGMKVAA